MTYTKASSDHIDELLELMREYYTYDHLLFEEKVMRARLHEFFKNGAWGEIRLIHVKGVTAGYFILLFGFGLEHGRNVKIDEFYIREPFRFSGIGRQTLTFIEETYCKEGVSSLHADVETLNTKAQRFWTSRGFKKYDRNPHIKMID